MIACACTSLQIYVLCVTNFSNRTIYETSRSRLSEPKISRRTARDCCTLPTNYCAGRGVLYMRAHSATWNCAPRSIAQRARRAYSARAHIGSAVRARSLQQRLRFCFENAWMAWDDETHVLCIVYYAVFCVETLFTLWRAIPVYALRAYDRRDDHTACFLIVDVVSICTYTSACVEVVKHHFLWMKIAPIFRKINKCVVCLFSSLNDHMFIVSAR